MEKNKLLENKNSYVARLCSSKVTYLLYRYGKRALKFIITYLS